MLVSFLSLMCSWCILVSLILQSQSRATPDTHTLAHAICLDLILSSPFLIICDIMRVLAYQVIASQLVTSLSSNLIPPQELSSFHLLHWPPSWNSNWLQHSRWCDFYRKKCSARIKVFSFTKLIFDASTQRQFPIWIRVNQNK